MTRRIARDRSISMPDYGSSIHTQIDLRTLANFTRSGVKSQESGAFASRIQ